MSPLCTSNTESFCERYFVGAGVVFLHAILVLFLIQTAKDNSLGIGNQTRGDGMVMVVEFIAASSATNVSREQLVPLQPDLKTAGQQDSSIQLDHRLAESAPAPISVKSQSDESPVNWSPKVGIEGVDPSVDASASVKGGDSETDLMVAYHNALRARIAQMWRSQTDRKFPSNCALRLSLNPGGALTATSASDCTISKEDRLQLEAAALMSQPLPYAGYEAVFSPDLRLQL